MKKFRELREDWRIGKLEKEIFQREATSAESDYKGVNMETSEDRDACKWTNRQAEYHKKRKEMLDYDSFEEFVSSVSSRQPSPERLVPRLTYREELLRRLEIEFNLTPTQTLKQIFQRLAKQNLVEDCERFCFSPIEFVSNTLQSHILLLVLKDLRRDEFMDIPLMESSSDESDDIPLLESSSDESDSWTDSDVETTDHSTAKALVVNPFNTQKYRNAPEERKDGWKKVKAV
jgi:hypothetical protein